ncbi:MAG: tRNA 5-methoxyuridine(34)/uridine 5-oxyacetic acid(34) synthase CmoB [Pseudomonadota bacterium]
MIDVESLRARWCDSALAPWAALLDAQVAEGLSETRYGDLPRWRSALEALPRPEISAAILSSARITASSATSLSAGDLRHLEATLQALHPWRKGPFEFCGLYIDTEWRSDWKWDRLAPHVHDLHGRRVLDVGCGNGYHCWRMRGAGAAEVIGIDPSPLFVAQFLATQHFLNDAMVTVLPVGIEALPEKLAAFDSVFSMGVLYHRRSPLEHLLTLRDSLRPGGQLVLETLVIEGDEQACLLPRHRYARMGNVWFLPSSSMLLLWLSRLGFENPRLVDETVTTTEEQRSTPWMRFHSLADFLDPDDPSLTIEGYPAPRRAIVLAESPLL